jgi:fermentation-respiration switch protein FrsA (DUF1100 family)
MASVRDLLNSTRRVLVPVAGFYVLLLVALFLLQSCLIYHPDTPTRAIVATPQSIGLAYEPVKIPTDDGLTLDAWFVPARNARGVLLFFHGNAGNISHRLQSIRLFNRLGLSTLILDYRGYGQSDGEPSEEGTYRDGQAAWRYLTERRGISPKKIVLFGRSLGGAIAAHAATQHQAGALILESAFTSVPDMAADIYWFLPVRWLTRFDYDTEAALASVTIPVMIIHSPDDQIVPFAHGRTLFAAAREPKQFLEISGGHNNGFLQSEQQYLTALEAFLETHFGK